VAETERQDYDLPPDWAALAKMIRSGELVEMPAVGDDYILYGVGARLSGEPLVHYDPKQRVEVPLYGGWDEWADADAQAAAKADGITQRIAAAQADLKKTAARERRRRRALAAEIRSLRTSLARLTHQRQRAAARST